MPGQAEKGGGEAVNRRAKISIGIFTFGAIAVMAWTFWYSGECFDNGLPPCAKAGSWNEVFSTLGMATILPYTFFGTLLLMIYGDLDGEPNTVKEKKRRMQEIRQMMEDREKRWNG